MQASSLEIISNQSDIHEHLEEIVQKHLATDFQKPISAHTQAVFDRLNEQVLQSQKPVILDSCCGVGESTQHLAELYPDALVIGLDKSACRLAKHDALSSHNYVLERVDLNDFWRLVAQAQWPVYKHYLLYPNPWPKSKHIRRRWHGAAVFPALLQIGGQLELRSNWKLYLEEFQYALHQAGFMDTTFNAFQTEHPMTPFERKYQLSAHTLWQLQVDLSSQVRSR
tara:strand:- start:319 stop:993 length:675 start_codon:yes stop_codon:yes gene_type:complete